MHIGSDVFGPEALNILQYTFDSIWNELAQDQRVNPSDRILKDYVSLVVMNAVKNDGLDVETIRDHVLQALES